METAKALWGKLRTTIYTVILTRSIDEQEHLGKDISTVLAKAELPLADLPAVTRALAIGNVTSPALELASPSVLAAEHAHSKSHMHVPSGWFIWLQ